MRCMHVGRLFPCSSDDVSDARVGVRTDAAATTAAASHADCFREQLERRGEREGEGGRKDSRQRGATGVRGERGKKRERERESLQRKEGGKRLREWKVKGIRLV